MIIFYPPEAQPRAQKVGSTVFTVRAYFCGQESIYHKLATLMEVDLLSMGCTAEPLEDTEKLLLDNSET